MADNYVGSLIAGGFALSGVVLSNMYTRRQQVERGQELRRATLSAIRSELLSLSARHQEAVGKIIGALAPGEAFMYQYPLIENYFTVYEGNVSNIGSISDQELRQKIINVYTLFKGMVDSFRSNNVSVQTISRLRAETAVDPQPAALEQLKFYLNSAKNYGGVLRSTHEALLAECQVVANQIEASILASASKSGLLHKVKVSASHIFCAFLGAAAMYLILRG